jgi:hypothetical protein
VQSGNAGDIRATRETCGHAKRAGTRKGGAGKCASTCGRPSGRPGASFSVFGFKRSSLYFYPFLSMNVNKKSVLSKSDTNFMISKFRFEQFDFVSFICG